MINDYMFDEDGNFKIKYTKDNGHRIIVKESDLTKANKIELQDGVIRQDGNLVISVDKNVIDEDGTRQNFQSLIKDPDTKITRYAVGSKITINDDKKADIIFKTIAANSKMEYGKAKYDKNGRIINSIWTSKLPKATSREPFEKLAQEYKMLDYTHSHPIRDPKFERSLSIGPSIDDIGVFKAKKSQMDSNPNTKNTSFHIYAPATTDSYIEYNSNGIKNWNDIPFDTPEKRNKLLNQNFENYRNKKENLIVPLYDVNKEINKELNKEIKKIK